MAQISITFKIDIRSPYLDEILELIESAKRLDEHMSAASTAATSLPSSSEKGNQHGNG